MADDRPMKDILREAGESADIADAQDGVEETPASYGIKETSELQNFLLLLIVAAVQWKGMRWTSIMSFIYPAIEGAIKAFDNIGDIPAELGDLDQSEITALVTQVKNKWPDADDETAAEIAEKCFRTVYNMADTVATVTKALKKPDNS